MRSSEGKLLEPPDALCAARRPVLAAERNYIYIIENNKKKANIEIQKEEKEDIYK
jgi:hypothetical protein